MQCDGNVKIDFFIEFLLGFYWPIKIISLILSRVIRKVGRKWEIPEKKHPQAELALSQMWPERGSNPQRWDDGQFRELKISGLNHSDTHKHGWTKWLW